MITILIANVIDFIAAMVQIWSGTLKDKKKILLTQTLQIGLQIFSFLLLGAITGAINNVVSCIRNLVCYKNWMTPPVKAVFIAVTVALTAAFNTQGLLGWLPAAICITYILLMDIKDPIGFKILVTASFFPWVFYYLVIRSYTGAFFAAATIVTNCISLTQMIRDRRDAQAK